MNRIACLVALALVAPSCEGGGRAAAPPSTPAHESVAPASPAAASPSGGMGAGDELQVSGTLGTLDEDDLNQAMRDRSRDFLRCYTKLAGGRTYLGGSVSVKVRVAADGAAKSAQIVASDLGAWDIERCVLAAVARMKLPRPQGGAEAEATLPVQFPANAGVTSWPRGRVSAAIARQRHALDGCAGARPSGLLATVYVGPDGTVESAGLSADQAIDEAYGRCVVERLSAWKLPDTDGGVAKVQFPLE